MEEEHLEDGSVLFTFNKRGSTFGLILVTLFFLIIMTPILLVLLLGTIQGFFSLIALSMLIIVYLAYLYEDHSGLIIKLSENEFTIEKLIRNKRMVVYKMFNDNIDEFIFEPAAAILTVDKTLVRNLSISPLYGQNTLIYSVGLRDNKNQTYLVNVIYGSNDEKKCLKENLNKKLKEFRSI